MWEIQLTPAAIKDLAKIDRSVAARILSILELKIAPLADPRTLGMPLKGEYSFWRWRVGDYRIIGRVDDSRLVILVVAVGHRREIYR